MDEVIKNFLPKKNYLDEIAYDVCERYSRFIDRSLIERGGSYVLIPFTDGQVLKISQEKTEP